MKQLAITVRVSDQKVTLYFLSDAPRIQIFREEEAVPGMGSFNTDRCLDAAVCVFDGQPEKFSRNSCWMDASVKVGGQYYYWIKEIWEDREALSHPVAVRIRDARIWWSRDQYNRFMDDLAADFPEKVVIKECGISPKGYPMRYIVAGNGENCIAYVGAVHAGESGPEVILPAIRRMLETSPELFEKVGIAMLPAANPDQRQRHVEEGHVSYIRTTANGVDINRNFPSHWEDPYFGYGMSSDCFLDSVYKGPCPASEAETRAIMEYVHQVRPKVIFSCHWMCGICLDSLLTSGYAKDDTAYTAALMPFIHAYAQGFTAALGKTVSPNGTILRPWCSNGSLPDWAYMQGIPAFDIEGHFDDLPIDNYPEFEGCKEDRTTPEMIELCSRGHESAMRKVMEVLHP